MVGLFIIIAFITDATKRIIPNWLTVSAALLGVLWHAASAGWSGLGFAAVGMVCGLVPFLAMYAIKAVGAGDVKLFAALGAITGALFTLQSMVASLLCAGAIGICILLWRSDRFDRLRGIAGTLLHIAVFRSAAGFRSDPATDGRLRFPFMWAVLPGVTYTYWSAGSAVLL